VPQSHLKPVSSPTATALSSDLELKESEDAWKNTRENNLK